ncbi:hypothetical protein H7J86_26160 [Mycobacterium hackensackense]|uniref:hypothetical protein n=1 Tax=Mycobacterium hackensackense TaxID=228909 RepID=UPI002265E23C|nr:hypothetical protein [Mycobacterium hackensackense]MCV7255653.1 hypothetical protein [Mycobacterium hackensackense]
MALQWIRLDTTFPDNPKIMDLVDTNQHRVVVAHVSMMCHIGKTETDGYFPEGALRRYGITKKDAGIATESGLWVPAQGGWAINGWAEHNPVDAAAAARSARASKAARKRWENRDGEGENTALREALGPITHKLAEGY